MKVFFYSEKQKSLTKDKNEVLTPDGWKEYTEVSNSEIYELENFPDAKIVYMSLYDTELFTRENNIIDNIHKDDTYKESQSGCHLTWTSEFPIKNIDRHSLGPDFCMRCQHYVMAGPANGMKGKDLCTGDFKTCSIPTIDKIETLPVFLPVWSEYSVSPKFFKIKFVIERSLTLLKGSYSYLGYMLPADANSNFKFADGKIVVSHNIDTAKKVIQEFADNNCTEYYFY